MKRRGEKVNNNYCALKKQFISNPRVKEIIWWLGIFVEESILSDIKRIG